MKIAARLATAAALAPLLALAGCGKTVTETVTVTNNVIVTRYVQVTAAPSNYQVELVPGAAATVGKSTFQLVVTNRPEGTAATNALITLKPVMYMPQPAMPDMVHGAPADVVTELAGTPGTYAAAVYYLMASGPMMGYWDLTATVNGETVTFGPEVGMAMGTDSVRVNLWGPSDAGMSAMATNKYFLFLDGPFTAASGGLPIHLSRAENMLMDFRPVYPGATLASGPVTSVSLTASTDGGTTFPITATHLGDGHWRVPLTGLVAGTARTVQLKLAVDGEEKTTDGAAPAGGNASVPFTATPR